ncbi:hypothetical protein LSH36_193g10025 [Paralvinella palmiformis]|uniref:DNA-binding protein RFX6 n=1 Tax=Paralvinella palmiformis TaxID=53620 RepID=A0AAD9N6K3_9ANNE|nr:hypothetical protein LSH36_193g10025 [Paralvinella palmiformis]
MSSHIILDDVRHSGEDESGIFRDDVAAELPVFNGFEPTGSLIYAQSTSFDDAAFYGEDETRPERRSGIGDHQIRNVYSAGTSARNVEGGFQIGSCFSADFKDQPVIDCYVSGGIEQWKDCSRQGLGIGVRRKQHQSSSPSAGCSNQEADGDKRDKDMAQSGSTSKIVCNSDVKKSSSIDSSEKHSQLAVTLKWLTDNYEKAEGVCLPRCVLYAHYLDLCKRNDYTPAGAATFGKLIRQRFPKLTTRRLGTRGQSKYHYYGIGIKESSVYYHAVYTGKGLTRFSGTKVKTEGSSRKFSLSAKTGTLLPEFPDVNDIVLPTSLDKDKVETFIMMYRTHCQRILDTIISANFDEVHNFLLHFWQGMPEHLVGLLSHDVIADIVSLCDTILYRVLLDVLIPTTIQDLPESLCYQMKTFLSKLPTWMARSLDGIPETMTTRKRETVTTFVRCLRRQISFIHLAQTARTLLTNTHLVGEMLKDIEHIDLTKVAQQCYCTDPLSNNDIIRCATEYFTKLKILLRKQAPIEAITEWLDDVIDSCVSKESDRQTKAAKFVLQWTIFESLILRDLTLSNVSTYGSIHLLHIMLDEYIFLAMDTYNQQVKERQVQAAVRRHLKDGGSDVSTNRKSDMSGAAFPLSTSKKRKREDMQRTDKKFSDCVGVIQTKLITSDQNNSSSPVIGEGRISTFDYSYPRLYKHQTPDRESLDPLTQSAVSSSAKQQPIVPHVANLDQHYLSQFGLRESYPKSSKYPGVVYDVQLQNAGTIHPDSLAASSFNLAGSSGPPPYWSGPYPDGFPTYYCHRRYFSNYDSHNCSMALLRVNPEGYHRRSAFDPTTPPYDHVTASGLEPMPYYNVPPENYNNSTNNYSQFNHYQSSFSQFGRQEAISSSHYNRYSHNLTSFAHHSFNKSVVSPFR